MHCVGLYKSERFLYNIIVVAQFIFPTILIYFLIIGPSFKYILCRFECSIGLCKSPVTTAEV